MDNLTREQRHKNMRNIKSRDTSIELTLRKKLWENIMAQLSRQKSKVFIMN